MRRSVGVASTRPGGWRPSNYPVLLAVLLLAATGLAVFVSTERAANDLAGYAFLAFLAGVVLRVGEHLAGAHTGRAMATLAGRLSGLTPTPSGTARGPLSFGEHRGTGRLDWSAGGPGRDLARVARDLAIGTATGGLLIVLVQAYDPAVVVSGAFLTGWTLALWLASAAAVTFR